MAIKANIVIDQGTDFETTIDVLDENDQPLSLIGYTVASQMRKNYTSTTAITFTTTHNDSLGQIKLSLTKAKTEKIEPGRYLYDVEMTSAEGITKRVVEGIVTVSPGITRI